MRKLFIHTFLMRTLLRNTQCSNGGEIGSMFVIKYTSSKCFTLPAHAYICHMYSYSN